MSEHEFVLNIDVAERAEPEVRMWIDDPQTHELSSEREIRLVRTAQSAWSGRFEAHGPFIYRIGIVAASGSHWALEFRTTGEEAQELLFDSDELTMTKEWLVGTCEGAEPLPHQPRRDVNSGLLQLLDS
jgi:hypothetical protein